MTEATLYASCGDWPEQWKYAQATITVTDAQDNPDNEPRIWLSHDLVSVGYFLRVSGYGCPAGVEVQVGEQVGPASRDGDYWSFTPIIDEGVEGEIPVTATCGDGSVEYPSTVVTVSADGNFGTPVIPRTGDEPTAEPTEVTQAEPTVVPTNDQPGLPPRASETVPTSRGRA